MKYLQVVLFSCSLLWAETVAAQVEFREGIIEIPEVMCMTPEQEKEIKEYLLKNLTQLKAARLIPETNAQLTSKLIWTLRPVATLKDPSYFGVVNFVDQEKTFRSITLHYQKTT